MNAADPSSSSPPPWPGYLQHGFFQEDGRLHRDLVWPERILVLVQRLKDGEKTKDGIIKLAPTQMRRWFHAFRRVEFLLERDPSRWAEAEEELALIRARSASAFGTGKIPNAFLALIHGCIDAVMRADGDAAKAHAFTKGLMRHLEVFIGYATGPLKENERR